MLYYDTPLLYGLEIEGIRLGPSGYVVVLDECLSALTTLVESKMLQVECIRDSNMILDLMISNKEV